MYNNKLKIAFAVTLAFLLNASVFAYPYFNVSNDSSKTALILKDNKVTKSPLIKLNSDFEAFMIKIAAIKRSNEKSVSVNFFDFQKPIDNVKIFPNPVSSQFSISYFLKKDNQVTIKLLDVLGNEITTLLDQKLQAGDQTNSFVLNSKISSGFYFIRIVSGNESVIKRISVI